MYRFMEKRLTISEAAKHIGVSEMTLRRWDKSGKFKASFISPGGHRYYAVSDLDKLIKGLFGVAMEWIRADVGHELSSDVYCENSAVFQVRLNVFSRQLLRIGETEGDVGLVVTVVGEIGNNSFDHNIGNWPDVPGVFFSYDLNRRVVVIADRGQGVRHSLERARPDLTDDCHALKVAFTEFVSGRAPEQRGNGLKLVHSLVTSKPMALLYQSGDALLQLDGSHQDVNPRMEDFVVRGTIVKIEF